MKHQPVLHVQKIREWLKTYPGGQTMFDIDGNMFTLTGNTSDIPAHITEFPPSAMVNSEMIAQTNARVFTSKDVLGNEIDEWQIQMIVYARRWGGDDSSRLEVLDFVTDFLQWAKYQQRFGGVPKFGNTDQHREKFELSGGTKIGDVEGQSGVEDYMFQLTLTYYILYETQ